MNQHNPGAEIVESSFLDARSSYFQESRVDVRISFHDDGIHTNRRVIL